MTCIWVETVGSWMEFIRTDQWHELMIWQCLNSVSDVDWWVYAIVFDANDINKNENLKF